MSASSQLAWLSILAVLCMYIYFSQCTDKLTEKEFIEGTLANKEILRLIQFEPQKVKEKIKNA